MIYVIRTSRSLFWLSSEQKSAAKLDRFVLCLFEQSSTSCFTMVANIRGDATGADGYDPQTRADYQRAFSKALTHPNSPHFSHVFTATEVINNRN